MKKLNFVRAGIHVLLLYLIITPVSANDLYLGAGVAQAEIESGSCSDLNDPTPSTCSIDGSDIGFKLYGGYQLRPQLAIEYGYVNLGEAKFAASINRGSGQPPFIITGGGKAEGFFLQAVIGAQVLNKLTFFASAGLLLSDTDVAFTIDGFQVKDSGNDIEPKFGLGTKVALSEYISVRGEWERYLAVGDDDTDESDIDHLMLGIEFLIP